MLVHINNVLYIKHIAHSGGVRSVIGLGVRAITQTMLSFFVWIKSHVTEIWRCIRILIYDE